VDYTPILNGPPGFVVLALVFAVAAYLRQVNSSTLDLSDKIRGGLVWNFPISIPLPTHTKRKLDSLDFTNKILSRVAPVMVWLAIIAALRIVIYSAFALPFGKSLSLWLNSSLPWIDFAITSAVFLMFLVLGCVHWRARRTVDLIRKLTRQWESGRNG
jgi:hypothetical protein